MVTSAGLDAPNELDRLILTEYPYPIAVNYKRLLDEQDWEKKTRICIQVFELGLRAIALGLISQYLIRDAERVSDPQLNQLLLKKLSRASLGTWNEMFFKALKAYQGKRNLFFMPELYELYWDTSTSPHRPHKGIRAPFDQLVQIRNELEHGAPPTDKAGWQALFEEAFHLLRQVLSHFTFLENYDLIRIRWAEGEAYWYDIYTGLQIISPSQPLRTKEDLTEGWFYLSKEEEKFLELHPLLIFWEKELVQAERERMRDAAIFDCFRRTSLDYLTTVLGGRINLTDRTLIAEFIHTVYYTIEKVKMARREAKKLTWGLLKEVAEKISLERIGDVRSKYRREVYLQREETKQTFGEFLASDKTCLVLIGKSGVGKSNFFLSLMDEYEDSSEVCTLMYNGARFSAETSVADALTRDFELYLKLEGLVEEEGVKDILFEINRIEGIADGKVVLLIDALNENPDARGLLRRVDALVEANPCPWLKVVISSRPETWRTIKRGVRLAEHKYYREEETGELGVEMQPFSIEVEMKPFAREELPVAYAKYQEAFELQTDYEAIPTEVQHVLRDPLTLWLVAEIHRGQEIPQDIQVSELYQEYVNVLIRTERLYREDIRFLEQELMPLMIQEGEYANSIAGETISVARTTDGKSLFELIHSDEVLSSGRRVNQSYANLVDAEILMELGTDVDYEIAFKYERFYEYYAGKRIFEISKTQADRHVFFLDMVRRTTKLPFLWGAVKNALVQDVKDRGPETVVKLCFTDDQRVKEMMVHVFIDFGHDNPAQVGDILRHLIPPAERANSLQRVWRLFHEPPVTTDVRSRNAQKIAVEAASSLGIAWVLGTAALRADPTIRTAAVRYTYHLWQREPGAGFEILETLTKNAIPGLIPDFTAFESVLGLSLIIFFDHPRDEAVLKGLQSIWRVIIAKIFGIQESDSGWGNLFRAFIREQIFSFVIAVIFQLFRDMPAYAIVNYPDLEAFFQLGATEKELYRRLTRYLDPEGDYSKKQMENDFFAVLRIRNLLIGGVALMDLVAQTSQVLVAFLPFLRKLFEEAQRDPLPSPYLTDITEVLSAVLNYDPMVDEIFDFFVHAVEVCQEYYVEHPQIPGLSRDLLYYGAEALYLAPYILYQYERTGTFGTDWLERRIQVALSRNNTSFFERLLRMELPVLGIEIRRPQLALDALALFFNSRNAEIEQLIQSFLSRLRVHYSDEVDDFLEEHQAPEEFRLQVRTNEPIETVGELIGLRSWSFFRDDVIVSSSTLRAKLICVLEKAADCKSAREWMDYAIREVINLAYGAEVLRQAK